MLEVEVTARRTRVDLRGVRHLDHAVITALEDAVDAAERQGSEELQFENSSADFLVGVDARWVVDRMLEDDFAAIADFVRRGQHFLRRLDVTPCRTIARVQGHVTGAGAEWIAACDIVVATPDTRIGLPETGLGIHPALGGTQRVPRRIGYAAARWAILTGTYLNGHAARALGWVDALDDEPLPEAHRAARSAVAPRIRDGWHDGLLEAFATRTLDQLRAGPRDGDRPDLRRALQRLSRRAPIALEAADRLLAASLETDLASGLQREITELATVYATKDALAGMRAGAEGRRATRFQGR